MQPKRFKMVAPLAARGPDNTWPARHPRYADREALARLMLDSYAGTIDDGGEDYAEAVAEVERTLGGGYGTYLEGCSFLVEDGPELAAASLITAWTDMPLVAFVMVAPALKGRGLGRFVLERSMAALWSRGQRRLALFVTDGNTPAQRLYDSLGFVVVE
jgi:GNAT superfamily N-acetyltransferase